MTPDEEKRQAALAALDYVEGGMRVGLGTGSTAAHFVACLGERVKAGLKVICVPTSEETRRQAEGLGIRLTSLNETPVLDLTVDGADELDASLNLIKGGGGALLREKIVAASSNRMIVIADHSKKIETLGKFPLPVEVVPFGWRSTAERLKEAARSAGAEGPVTLRVRNGEPFATDSGNIILDCAFGRIPDAMALSAALSITPGIVDHGLFIGMAELAIIGTAAGIETINPYL